MDMQQDWRFYSADGAKWEIGGTGLVYGSNGFQDVSVLDMAGTVTLDASFNKGGDVVRLDGAPLGWKVSFSGSTATFVSGETTVLIPVGSAGLDVVFLDGARTLRFDVATGQALLSTQVLTAMPETVLVEPDGDPIPDDSNSGAFSRLFLSNDASVTVGGAMDLIGTTGAESVTVLNGHAHFDASFNRGNDVIAVAAEGSDFEVEQTGSFATFVSDHGLVDIDVSIPAGTDGMIVRFEDGDRTLRYDPVLDRIVAGSQVLTDELEAFESAPDAAQDMVLAWVDTALDAIAAASVPPPVATRVLAMMSLAVHDALAAVGDNEGFLIDRQASGSVDLNAIVAHAAHDVLAALIPSQAALFDARLAALDADLGSGTSRTAGEVIAETVAANVIAARAGDHADAQIEYVYGTDPGNYVATGPGFAKAALPQWMGVTPFALTSADQFRGPPPPSVDSAEFAATLNQVMSLGAKDSTARTADQSQIAHFWLDGAGTYTPPGHWNAIAAEVSLAQGGTITDNANTFALLNMALADAAIAAWDMKYTYNFWRPVTAAETLNSNPLVTMDPDWQSYLPTPNHPTYVSGHSTFSGAAAGVLTALFGEDYAFSTSGVNAPGVTRSFDSFLEAAQEAGMSRIYGGIHYSIDNEQGLALGAQVADWVLQSYGMG